MQKIATGIAIVSAALGAFWYYGMRTLTGRHQFDEMAGMIPFFAGCVAILGTAISAILFAIVWKRS